MTSGPPRFPHDSTAQAVELGGEPAVLFLLFAETPTEESVLRRWVADRERVSAAHVVAGCGELARYLARAGQRDLELVPVRVAWLDPVPGGSSAARLRDLVLLREARRPRAAAQERIVRQSRHRYRVVVGESARLSELRQRFASRVGEDLSTFVERQGLLALERAERELVGRRYKVPRLVRQDMMASQSFHDLVTRLAQELGRDEADVRTEAEAALEEMVASQSGLAIDAWDQFGHWISRAFEIDVDISGLDQLHEINRSHALAFLPSHRSYLDPLVLRPVLQQHGFPPNHTLGGANLDFWPIGPLARRNGYIFIRRTMRDAPVYKAVLREYLGYLVRKRFNLEWYIEGGRSRTGKLRPPRYGILSYLVDAVREAGVNDVVLVPVSIVYDQLHEVGAMAAEERGAPKRAEGLSWLISYSRAQSRKLGSVHVAFGTPLSLAESLRDGGTVEKTAFEVMHRIGSVTPVTASAIVAFALLGGEDRALTFEEGRALVRPLIEYLEARGVPRVAGIGTGRTEVVRDVLNTLVREGVVAEYSGGAEPVYLIGPDRHVEAAFYRNNVIHHFVTGAIVELALLHLAEGEVRDPAGQVWAETLRLRDLFKFEFFFPRKRVFAEDVRRELSLCAPGWQSRPAEPDDVRAALRDAPVTLAHRVLGPFAEAYLVVAERLAARDPRSPLSQEAFLKECIGFGRQYTLQRRLDSPESVSRELFQGALRLAANRGLIEPGADRRAAREEFADEVRDVVRRVRAIRALARGRQWETR
jgi:glycerol-3-phosphate O-acyltransferase